MFLQKETYDIADLLEIMRILRSPTGCPWDREQTHETIRMDFIEEVYEAIEAIDKKDTELLREELGDVLLQVVFHAQIEQEQDRFAFSDICDELCKKLIVRHPHVFGDVQADTAGEVLKNWDRIKQETKGQTDTDTLTSVSTALPALMRAQKVGKRAMRAGMDFEGAADAFACIRLETEELAVAMANGSEAEIADELGDLLFSCVNTARHLNLDAEAVMTRATEKFIDRFAKTEDLLRHDGISMKSLSIEALDDYWRRAKKQK